MDRQEQAEAGVRDESGRWVKGTSGNPGGRPKGQSVLAEIERQLELESDDGRPQRERLVEKLFKRALAGDMRAMDLILKRVAPERLALEHEGGLPTVVIRDYTGLSYEALESRRRSHEQLELERPAIDAEVSEEGSGSEIEEREAGSFVEMEHAKPDPDNKPQPVTWVPLRPDENERPKVAQLD